MPQIMNGFGIDSIIFGCTEVGLIIAQDDFDIPTFDTTELHAKAALNFARFLPENPHCAAIIRQYGIPVPEPVSHAQQDQVRVAVTPPAGPDSIVCTGESEARCTLMRPPSERTMLTVGEKSSSFSLPLTRFRGAQPRPPN